MKILLSGLLNIETNIAIRNFQKQCRKKAVYFASYKIGESGGAKGFITEKKLEYLIKTA